MSDADLLDIVEGMDLRGRLKRSCENVVLANVTIVHDKKFGRVLVFDRVVGTHSQPLPADACKSAAVITPLTSDRREMVDELDRLFRLALDRLVPVKWDEKLNVARLLGIEV